MRLAASGAEKEEVSSPPQSRGAERCFAKRVHHISLPPSLPRCLSFALLLLSPLHPRLVLLLPHQEEKEEKRDREIAVGGKGAAAV